MAWKFLIEDDENIPAILWQEDVKTGFTDKVGDILVLDKSGESKIGFKRTRDLIKTRVILDVNPNYPTIDFSGWGTYPEDKKDIAIRWVIAPYSLRIADISDSQDSINWGIVVDKTKSGRAEIVEVMRVMVSEEFRKDVLTKDDLDDFWVTVETLMIAYVGANTVDFNDWLINKIGSAYQNNGFEQKSYWSQALEDDLMFIYNGEY